MLARYVELKNFNAIWVKINALQAVIAEEEDRL